MYKFLSVGFWLSFIKHLLNVTYQLLDYNNSTTTFTRLSYYLQERIKHHSYSLFHQTSKPARNQDAVPKLLEAFKPLPDPFILHQDQCNYPILSIKQEYQRGASFQLHHSRSFQQYSWECSIDGTSQESFEKAYSEPVSRDSRLPSRLLSRFDFSLLPRNKHEHHQRYRNLGH